MRFRCQFEPSSPIATPPKRAPGRRIPAAPLPAPTMSAHAEWPVRGAVFGAMVVVAAGCATLDPNVAQAWRIEPAFSETHSLQSSQAYYTMGRHHDASGRWNKAVEAYRKAIAVDGMNVEAYNALGVALAQSGRYADAETTLRQAVALAPDRSHVQNNLGYVLLLSGKAREAVPQLQAAVELDAANDFAKANLRLAMERSAPADGVAGPAEPAAVAVAAAPASIAPEPAPAVEAVAPLAPHLVDPPTVPREAGASEAVRLEISNGNGAPRMAARVGRWLATQGVQADRLTNQKPYSQQETVIQYRSGFEQAALRVARSLPAMPRSAPMPADNLRSDVRVVLGRDWVKTAACLEHDTCRPGVPTLAMATSP